MKKNMIVTAGLISTLSSIVVSNESLAMNEIDNINENSRSTTQLNKKGKVKNVKSNDVLNVRVKPSADSSLVFTLKNGTEINVLAQDNATSWYKVSYNGKEGYASNRYIEIIGDMSTKYTVTADINLRKEASWSGEIITIAKKGSTLDVISISGAWAKVNYNNTVCYAPSSYLEKAGSGSTTTTPSQPSTPSTPSQPSTPEITKSTIATVTTDGLNIRAGGGMSYSILAKANKGDIVLIKENKNSNGWYKVELTSGIVGWCYEDYLENFREGTLPSNPSNGNNSNNNGSVVGSVVVSGQIATVNTDDLNIRTGMDTIYPILAKVNTGDKVLIKEKDSSGWYKVQLSNGVIGWCNSVYLKDIKEGSITVTSNGSSQSTPEELINKVISVARQQIGKPYKYGANGPGSFDCSGLMEYIFKNGANITLPRNSKAQAGVGKAVSKSNLQPGDLIFFNTSGSGISHVGIYIGNDEMIHAPSSGKTISIVKITQSYWASRYVSARRIIY